MSVSTTSSSSCRHSGRPFRRGLTTGSSLLMIAVGGASIAQATQRLNGKVTYTEAALTRRREWLLPTPRELTITPSQSLSRQFVHPLAPQSMSKNSYLAVDGEIPSKTRVFRPGPWRAASKSESLTTSLDINGLNPRSRRLGSCARGGLVCRKYINTTVLSPLCRVLPKKS